MPVTDSSQEVHAPPLEGSRKKEKDLSIETMRGMAIVLVVAGYLVRSDIIKAGQVSFFASLMKFFYFSTAYIRMPLFTAISGYLYAATPATSDTIKKLYLGKARRLLIPFFTVSSLQYLVFSIYPLLDERPVLSNIARIFIYPFHQFWFIYAVFFIFILVGALDALKALDTPKKWGTCVLISLVFNFSLDHMNANVLSIPGVNYLLPYFLLGYGLRRYSSYILSVSTLRILCGIFILSFGFQEFLHFRHISMDFHGHRVLGALVAFSGLPILFHLKRPIPILAWLGGYAFCIHLFYLFGVGATHYIFKSVVQSPPFFFLACLAVSIALPILIQEMLERSSAGRRFILGQRA